MGKRSTAKMRTIEKNIVEHVQIGSRIITDDFMSYYRISKWFAHERVQHTMGQYVREVRTRL